MGTTGQPNTSVGATLREDVQHIITMRTARVDMVQVEENKIGEGNRVLPRYTHLSSEIAR